MQLFRVDSPRFRVLQLLQDVGQVRLRLVQQTSDLVSGTAMIRIHQALHNSRFPQYRACAGPVDTDTVLQSQFAFLVQELDIHSDQPRVLYPPPNGTRHFVDVIRYKRIADPVVTHLSEPLLFDGRGEEVAPGVLAEHRVSEGSDELRPQLRHLVLIIPLHSSQPDLVNPLLAHPDP